MVAKMNVGWFIERSKVAKFLIFNVPGYGWTSKEEMNRLTFSIIFFSGVVFAVTLTFLSEYFKAHSCDANQYSIPVEQKKAFSPLPDESQLHVHDEGTISLALRRSDVSEKVNGKTRGKIIYL